MMEIKKMKTFDEWFEENYDAWEFEGCTPKIHIESFAEKAWDAALEEIKKDNNNDQ